MSELEVRGSEIYLQKEVVFEHGKKYLIKANSGRGKSSILNFIYGSNLSYDGSINFDNLDETNIISVRNNKLSYVFQDFKLFLDLSVIDNIKIKNNLTNHKTEQEILELINKVGLAHKENQLVKELSLGQRQRVSIIRSLCQPFEFLLLDEPFSHLDENNIKILTTIINEEIKFRKAGFILSTLNDEYLFKYDQVIKL